MNEENDWSGRIIGAAIEVHRQLGPGLPEALYEEALCVEMEDRGIPYERQRTVPVLYKTSKGTCKLKDHRLDLVVAGKVVVELKAADRTPKIVEWTVLSYLRFSGCRLGLVLNFHAPRLVDGVRRLISTSRSVPSVVLCALCVCSWFLLPSSNAAFTF